MAHRRYRRGIAVVLIAFAGLGPATYWGQTDQDKWGRDIEKERNKLAKEKDPADRAESLMKIADLTLNFLGDAVRANNLGAMESYVWLYRQTVTDARDAMMLSGLDPYKKPRGYKLIETGLRKQLRILEDLERTLTLEARKPIESAKETASKVRNEMLKALFR